MLLTHHLQYHCLAMNVGTGMGFQLGMSATNEYFTLTYNLENKSELKMAPHHKKIQTPFGRIS